MYGGRENDGMTRRSVRRLILALGCRGASRAQGQYLGGMVLDKQTAKPLNSVRVVLLDSGGKSALSEVSSGANGTFLLQVPAAGIYRVAFARDLGMLALSHPVAVADTAFVQRQFELDLSTVGFYLESQVTAPVMPKPGNPTPRYPVDLRNKFVSGEVIVQFVVDTTGRADMNTLRVQLATDPGFAEAVQAALPAMQFFPARIEQRLVRQVVFMPFSFSIR